MARPMLRRVAMTDQRARDQRSEWVLVADGDEAAAVAVAQRFSTAGLLAFPTSTGGDAVLLVRTGRIAVAVVGDALEDQTGHALVAMLTTLDPKLRIIMTVSPAWPEAEANARRMGIIHYAPKPLDVEALVAIVSRTVRDSGQNVPCTCGGRQ